jgi:hypothetical protein
MATWQSKSAMGMVYSSQPSVVRDAGVREDRSSCSTEYKAATGAAAASTAEGDLTWLLGSVPEPKACTKAGYECTAGSWVHWINDLYSTASGPGITAMNIIHKLVQTKSQTLACSLRLY